MVYFRYTIVRTLHRGGSGDIDYDENNINIVLTSVGGEHYFRLSSI